MLLLFRLFEFLSLRIRLAAAAVDKLGSEDLLFGVLVLWTSEEEEPWPLSSPKNRENVSSTL